MACRSCSSSLGRLPRRPVPSLRQQQPFVESTPRSVVSASTSSPARPPPPPSCARGLHTTPAARHLQQQQQQQRRPKASSGDPAAAATKEEGAGGLAQRLASKFASAVRRPGDESIKSAVVGSYASYKATERLAAACARQADYSISAADRKAETVPTAADGEEIGVSGGGVWHKDFDLPPTFSTWAQVSMLHMYLLVVRMRCVDDRDVHARWQSQLVDHFFAAAEERMVVAHAMASGGVRQRFLRDLFVQWRGLLLAYDEGLVRGDAVLASAVWRNLYKARADVDVRALAAVVSWIRACLVRFERMDDVELLAGGERVFAEVPAGAELATVDRLATGPSAAAVPESAAGAAVKK
ncbi:ubiquinol-cytochrome C chaperone-domain-containing protein [Lasiosphaeria ovina]|uniref:Ubiquinol-cytochrome C chaperone-domain-containing protein n=1 Tax=Lasiosphaeria ovina TaxID=92902 RepID=A0AAE0TUH4_9PEZI|nr:ubiquinol-cytochrome C chaperone-domain-containing protein [Lasiosphaeria ovina]